MRRRLLIVAIFLLAGAVVNVAVAASLVSLFEARAIRYVDDDAPLGGDGTSWDTAYRFPQDALAFASDPANGIAEIRVAQGVYLTDRDRANPDGSNVRESTFQLLNGLALRGGYAGIGAPDPNERDVDLFLTILTGDIGRAGSSVDNSYHVVTASGTDETAVLDGFTITGGNACCVGSQLDPRRLGGGLYNLGGDARLISCTFTGNSACAGGGLYNEAGALSVTDCTFSGNVATGAVCIGAGGGMYTVDADPTLTNCTFTGNIAERGGGLGNKNGNPSLTNCTFLDNTALDFYAGGGVYTIFGNPVFTNCTFTDNLARDGRGGGIFHANGKLTLLDCIFSENVANYQGGAIHMGSAQGSTITRCTFLGNAAPDFGRGGAVTIIGGSSPIFTRCRFADNWAVLGGGAIDIFLGSPVLVDCLFSGNFASFGSGGALLSLVGSPTVTNCRFVGNWADDNGGALALSQGELKLTNCAFLGNSADRGGAVIVGGNATVSGCRFLGNSAEDSGGAMYIGDETALVAANCIFSGNWTLGRGGAMLITSPFATMANCIFSGNSAILPNSGRGGAIYNLAFASPTLANCTFAGNSAQDGGAMYSQDAANATLTNCILWGNSPNQLVNLEQASTVVLYSDIEGGWEAPGQQNINADPIFFDPDGADDIVGTEDDNLRLAPGSPCIDAANNWGAALDMTDLDNDRIWSELTPIDLDGNPRFVHATISSHPGCGVPAVVDMGAYEFPAGRAADIKLGDIDGDGTVGMFDLVSLIISWGPAGGGCQLADFDLDGIVAVPDLLTLLANWG